MNTFDKTLSIIVPCYNEEESVPLFYAETMKQEAFFHQKGVELEFVFVNDGSKDKTVQVVKELREKLVQIDEQLREYRQILSTSDALFKDAIYKEFKVLETDRAKVRNELKYKNVRITELQRLMSFERKKERAKREDAFHFKFHDAAKSILSDADYQLILKMVLEE